MKQINGLVDVTLLICACVLVHCKPIQNSNTQENGSNSPSKSQEELSHLSSIGKTTRNHSQKNAVDDYEKHNRNQLMSSLTDSFKQGEPSNTKMSSEKFSGTHEKNFPRKFSKLSRSDFHSPADEVGKLERKGIYGGTIKNKKSSAATYKGTDSKQSNDNRNSVRKHPKATRKGGSTDNTKKGSKISTKPETPIQDMHKEIKYPDTRKKENEQSAIPEKYIVETKDGEVSSVAESEYEESSVHDEILENGSSRNVEEIVTKEEPVGNSPALPDMIWESSISEHGNNIVTTNTVGTGDVAVTNTGKEEAPVETTALTKTTLNKDNVVNVTKVVDRSNDSREENSTVRAVITEISTLSEMETTENDAESVTAAVENSRTLVDLKTTMSVKERETESILPDTAEIDEKVDHTQTTETEEILQDRYTTASPSETKTKSFTSRGSTSREKREEVSHEIFPEEVTTFSPQSSDTPKDAETSIKAETEALPTSTERDTSSSLTETVGTTHSVSVAGESGETRATTAEEGKISSESSVTITEIFPTNEPESDTDSGGITSAVPDKETEASASTQVTEKDFPMETITSQESTTIPDEVTDSPKKEVTETHEEEDLPSETITNQENTPSTEEVTSTPKEEVTETQEEKDLPSETLPSQENTPSPEEVTSTPKEEVTETQEEKDLPSETLPSQENTPRPEEVTSTPKEEVTETQEEKDLPSETLPSQENTPSPEEVSSTPKEEVTETQEEKDLPSETLPSQENTPSPEEVTSTPKEKVTETQEEKDLPSETLPSQENTPSPEEVTSTPKEEVTETQEEKDLPSETLPSQENTPSPEEVTSTPKEEVTETQEEKDLPSETLPSQENTPSPEEVTSTPKEEVTETPSDVSKEDSTQSKTTSIHESTTSSDLTSVDEETETVSPESVTTEKKGDPTETTTTSGESASDIVTSPTAEKETQTESFEGEATETTVSSSESSTIKLEPTSNTQSSTSDITKDATFPDVEEATKASPSSTETTMTTHETPTSTFESSLSTRGSTSETRHPNPTTKSDATTGEDSGNLTSPGEEPKDVCQVSDEEADTYIDDAITRLIPRIREPSNMPNRTGRFYLYNGVLHGLSTVHRSGSSKIYCRRNFVYFKVPAGAKNLQAMYDWHYRAFFRNWQGTVLFSVREFKTDALYVAVKERGNSGLSKLRVKNFKIDSIDGLRVEFTGLGPLNSLASFFTRIVMSTFRKSLVRSIEKPIENAMNEELEKHNWK